MSDATFDQGHEAPLNLGALSSEDLEIVSTLAQDAVFGIGDMTWRATERRFAILLNRFRWEDHDAATRRSRPYERVRSLLVIDHVLGVSSQGIDRSDKDMVLSLLNIAFVPTTEGAGHVMLTFAGTGDALRLSVEALELTLKDVTRPYEALSGKAPHHSD